MKRLGGWIGLVVLLLTGPVRPVWATQPGRCTIIDEISPEAGAVYASSTLSSEPARVCSVEFLASGANGWARVFDPLSTAKNVSEPGQATSGNHAFIDLGEQGYITEAGLQVQVFSGRVIVRWGR